MKIDSLCEKYYISVYMYMYYCDIGVVTFEVKSRKYRGTFQTKKSRKSWQVWENGLNNKSAFKSQKGIFLLIDNSGVARRRKVGGGHKLFFQKSEKQKKKKK